MKYQLLILWTLAAFFSCQTVASENEIKVEEVADGIKLSCGQNPVVRDLKPLEDSLLTYRDDNTGEYSCQGNPDSKIFVKFRTCDNCVELDVSSIAGLAVGDVVATVVVGVAVYLIASQARGGQVKPTKKTKGSDKQNLIRNEAAGESYQPLRFKKGDRVEYDVLNRK